MPTYHERKWKPPGTVPRIVHPVVQSSVAIKVPQKLGSIYSRITKQEMKIKGSEVRWQSVYGHNCARTKLLIALVSFLGGKKKKKKKKMNSSSTH